MFCAELSEMLSAGISAPESFLLLAEKEPDPKARALFQGLYEGTDAGAPASRAMRKAGVFPEYALRMIALGEKTGALDRVLASLGAYYERQRRMRLALRAAVFYPLVLFFVILAVFCVFTAEVLPVFDRVFRQIGASMSAFAEGFLRFGLWLNAARWAILGVAAALVLVILAFRFIPPLRRAAGRFFSDLFAGTGTGRRIAAARTAGVLALCVSGTPELAEALGLARAFAAGFDRDGKLARCAALVEKGKTLSEAAGETGLFSPAYRKMLAVGEKTGALDAAMGRVAARAEAEMETALDRAAAAVEPAAVILLSLLVGLLLLSVMLPLVGILSAL